jgi:hypothetical protein
MEQTESALADGTSFVTASVFETWESNETDRQSATCYEQIRGGRNQLPGFELNTYTLARDVGTHSLKFDF